MLDLFRFVLLRPSVPVDGGSIIPSDLDSHLQQQLKEDRREASPLEKMQGSADDFVSGGSFISDLGRLALDEGIRKLSDALSADLPSNRQELSSAIAAAFGMGVADLVANGDFAKDRMRLIDSLIAAKLATSPPAAPLMEIARYIRLQALILRCWDDDEKLDEQGAIEMVLNGHIVMPAGLLPLPDKPPEEPPETPGEREREGREKKEEAEREYRSLKDAYRFLTELEGDDLVMDLEDALLRHRPPARGRPDDALRQELRQLRETIDQRLVGEGPVGMLLDSTAAMHRASMRIRPQALERAPEPVREALHRADIDPLQVSIPVAAETLRRRMEELFPVISGAGGGAIALLGGQAVPASSLSQETGMEDRHV
ncbi:hypothetical protein [Mesorhizobium sp.]|uniref:hypothetical protein n=1 Tax=Mesorhizobium sp. TaxID=1871066 RepID=UPI000FE867D3|nr:hypothetical protein [Mesorhizobium sp.]RWA97845.1 MAG: hypothetical protein EOQ33_29845 [Mesorhizobium sp.]